MRYIIKLFLKFILLLFLLMYFNVNIGNTNQYNNFEFINKGNASFYNKGKITASGEKFDLYKMSAAHFYLPFGTKVRVINIENNKYIDVIINDRGPFYKKNGKINIKKPHEKFIIDLTPVAFKKLGEPLSKGIINVEVYKHVE